MAPWTVGSHRAQALLVAWAVGGLVPVGPTAAAWAGPAVAPGEPAPTTPPPAEAGTPRPKSMSGPPRQPGTGGGRTTGVADPFAQPASKEAPLPVTDMSATEDLTRTWTYSQGRPAPPPRYVNMSAERVEANPIGFYSGVSVARAGTPPPRPPTATTGGPVLTWTGYEPKRPGSLVFFQFNGPVQHQMSQDGLTIEMRFPGASVTVRNNLRPLELTYHASVVKRVKVERRKGAVVGVIELKRSAAPKVRTVTAENGYNLVVLEFVD